MMISPRGLPWRVLALKVPLESTKTSHCNSLTNDATVTVFAPEIDERICSVIARVVLSRPENGMPNGTIRLTFVTIIDLSETMYSRVPMDHPWKLDFVGFED